MSQEKTTNKSTTFVPSRQNAVKEKTMATEAVTSFGQIDYAKPMSQEEQALIASQNSNVNTTGSNGATTNTNTAENNGTAANDNATASSEPVSNTGTPGKTATTLPDTGPEKNGPKPVEIDEQILEDLKELLHGKVTADEAIEAYKIVDKLSPEQRELLNKEHPYLMTTMIEELPASFLDERTTGFTKGIDNNKKDGKASGQQKMLDLLKEESTWKDLQLLEMVLSILAQNDDTHAEAKLVIYQLPFDVEDNNITEVLDRYHFNTFGKEEETIDKDEEAGDGKYINKWLFHKGEILDDDIGKRKHMAFHYLGLRKKNSRVEGLKLDEFQEAGGGTLGGMKFVDHEVQETRGSDSQSLVSWLGDKGVRAEDLPFDNPDKLKPGEISYQGDLENGNAHIIAASLPFERIDYVAGDLSVRGKDGAIRNLYMEASWKKPQKEDVDSGTTAIDLKILLREFEITQLRVILEEETYGMGRLFMNDVEVTIHTAMPSVSFKTGGNLIDALTGILSSIGSLSSDIALLAINRFGGTQDEKDNAKNSLARNLGSGFFGNLDVRLSFGGLQISNLVSTEMGYIGEISASNSEVGIKSNNKGEETSENEKLALLESKEELEKIKEKRSKTLLPQKGNVEKRKNKIDELTTEINLKSESISEKEKKVSEKETGKYTVSYGPRLSETSDPEGKDKPTNKLTFSNDHLLSQLVRDALNDTLTKKVPNLLLGDISDIDKIETEGVNFKTEASASEGVQGTVIEIDKVIIPRIDSPFFTYWAGENYIITGDNPVLTGTELRCLYFYYKDNEDSGADEAVVDEIFIPLIDSENMMANDLINKMQVNLKGLKIRDLMVKPTQLMSFIKSLSSDEETSGIEPDEKAFKATFELSSISLPRLHFGEEGDNLYIRSVLSSKPGKGVKLDGIKTTFSLSRDKKINVEHFEVNKVSAANLNVNYNKREYKIRGEAVIEGFNVNDVGWNLKTKSIETGKSVSGGWTNISIPEIWAGISRIKGLTADKLTIGRFLNDEGEDVGVGVELQGLDVDEMMYQEVFKEKKEDEKEKNNKPKLKSLVKSEIEGKSNLQAVKYDNGSYDLSFALPEGSISIPRIYYLGKNGDHIITGKKTPIYIYNPVIKVNISKTKKYKIENLSIDKIALSSGLDARFGDKEFFVPQGQTGEISDIKMHGLEVNKELGIHGELSTGKFDLKKVKIEIGNVAKSHLKATSNLKWDSFSFNGETKGAFHIEVKNANLGLGNTKKKLEDPFMYSNVKYGIEELNCYTDKPVFKAGKIVLDRQTDEQNNLSTTITITDPVLEEIGLEGKYLKDNSPIEFKRLVLSGSTKGNMVIKDEKDKITIKGVDLFTINKGDIILPEKKKPVPTTEPLDEKYPNYTGDFDFMNGANGQIVVELFNKNKFTLPIVKGYIKLEPFLEDLGNLLASKTTGRADWILDDLNDDKYIHEDEFSGTKQEVYGLSTQEWTKTGVYKLINEPNKNGNLIEIETKHSGAGKYTSPTITTEYYAKVSAILETINAENLRKAEYIERLREKGIKPEKKTDWFHYQKETENQINGLINDLEEPMNPKIYIEMDKISNKGLMSFFTGDVKDIDVDITFDQRMVNNRRKMLPIIALKNLSLPHFEMDRKGMVFSGDKIDIRKIDVTQYYMNEKQQEINVENINLIKPKFEIKKTKNEPKEKK